LDENRTEREEIMLEMDLSIDMHNTWLKIIFSNVLIASKNTSLQFCTLLNVNQKCSSASPTSLFKLVKPEHCRKTIPTPPT